LDLEPLARWINTTPLHDLMLQQSWAFPAAETIHFMGLSMLIGSLLIVDLRGMGLLRMIPFEQAHKLIPLAIIGFVANVITGVAFVFSDPTLYFPNTSFWYKMAFIALAGLNALAFELLVFRRHRKGEIKIQESVVAKATSALSLVFWLVVLILGRFLPFTEV
jgi:hypothetical protein